MKDLNPGHTIFSISGRLYSTVNILCCYFMMLTSSRSEVFYKKELLKMSLNSQKKICVGVSSLNKLQA